MIFFLGVTLDDRKNTCLKPKGYSSTRHEGTIWKCIIMDRHLIKERRSTKRTARFLPLKIGGGVVDPVFFFGGGDFFAYYFFWGRFVGFVSGRVY